jgi:hypothetical protein
MRAIYVVGVVVAGLAICAPPALATGFAGVDQPGPLLRVPPKALKNSLRCTSDVVAGAREPVLLVPPTLADPDEAFVGFERAFDALAIPYCTVTIPQHTTIDIQISAEYVVHAVRRMHAVTGGKVQLLGWSQGAGPEPRWALRFWPDIRPFVDDLVGLEAPNHGAVAARLFAQPALRQQADDARFIAALNSGQETFAGISYTDVYSHTSQFVQPNLDDHGTTSLHGGGGQIANIATQDICPLNAADHLAYWYDPVGYALTMDALSHPGPADPPRIDRVAVCAQASMPYVAAVTIPTYTAHLYNALFVDRVTTTPTTGEEPASACYVTATCGTVATAQPALTMALTYRKGRLSSGRRCARSAVRVSVGGADLTLVESSTTLLDARQVDRTARLPFMTTLARVTDGRRHLVEDRLQLTDGRLVTVQRRFVACGALRLSGRPVRR